LKTPDEDWLLWQLADSAFPTGGFAHSVGLEAAWQHGEIRNSAELSSFLEASLRQLAHSALPFAAAAHDAPEQGAELDRLSDAFLTNHVANRASRAQGRAFLMVVEKTFGLAHHSLPFGHFAPVFGGTARRLGLPRMSTTHLFFFQHLRALVAAAIRLGIVGPMEAQTLQHRLAPTAREILSRSEHLPVSAISQTAPLLELWQGTQDRLYSRLFQS
jgi:urease accessory protein